MKKIVFAGMLLFGLLLWLAGAEAEMRPKRVLLLRDFDANYRWPTLLSDRILDYYREEPEARAPSVTSVSLGGRNKESGGQFRFLVLDDLKKERDELVICLKQGNYIYCVTLCSYTEDVTAQMAELFYAL